MKILILNGPNLNLLGKREPEIYGYQTMPEILEEIKGKYPHDEVLYFQSNHEGALIDRLQEENYDALVYNMGAYTHTSYALADALKHIKTPKIEVHLSNLYQRETYRQKSVTACYANAFLSGFGIAGYLMAVESIVENNGV